LVGDSGIVDYVAGTRREHRCAADEDGGYCPIENLLHCHIVLCYGCEVKKKNQTMQGPNEPCLQVFAIFNDHLACM
jgi:hypothetical protein